MESPSSTIQKNTTKAVSRFAPTLAESTSASTPGYVADATKESNSKGLPSPGRDPEGLLAITQYLHSVENALIEAGGEVSQDLEIEFGHANMLKEMKIDGYHAVMKRCESVDQEFTERADRYYAVAKSAKALKKYLVTNLKAAAKVINVTELRGRQIRFAFSRNKPKLTIDLESLPEEYKTLKMMPVYDVNEPKIQAALAEGKTIPGVVTEESTTCRPYPIKAELK